MPDDVTEAPEIAGRICALIDELDESVLEQAPEFFEDVRARAASVGETIEAWGEVTDRQLQALENREAGVRRWIRE